MDSRKELGIDAENRDYAKYDQVSKGQVYRLAEESGEERFDDEFQVRTCDIAPVLAEEPGAGARFADELGAALEEIGFAILIGHGVDPLLYEEAERRTIELFTECSLEEKLRHRAERHGSVNQGYFPIEETSDIHPDLVEGWVFCRRAFDLDPDREKSFDPTPFWPRLEAESFFRRLVAQHEALILPLMRSILLYLGCDPHHYDERLTGTNFGLRLNYYPPITPGDDESGAGRLLGHEDVDLFTILPAPAVEGLQVLHRQTGKWIRLQAPPGSIILNTGDYMQRITNDRLPSTTHRVSKPRDRSLIGIARVSTPMAVYVWEDEILEVLPGLTEPHYEPIRAITFHTRSTSKFYGDDYAVEE